MSTRTVATSRHQALRLAAPPATALAAPGTAGRPGAGQTVTDPVTGFFQALGAFFNNQTPNLNPHQISQSSTGVITGELDAVDPDSPTLTYTVTQNPLHGAVIVSPEGDYTYTPQTIYVHTGITDSFTVTVSDAASGFAIHGLAGLLNLLSFGLIGSRGDSSTHTVTVTVAPVTDPPVVGATPYVIDSTDTSTGIVRGHLNVTDPNNSPLAYQLNQASSNTAAGVVSVDPGTGAWTYTPSVTALTAAQSSPTPISATFAVTASNGPSSVDVIVSAPIQITAQALAPLLARQGSRPSGVAVGADGSLYVINSGANTLSVLSPNNSSILSTTKIGASPTAVVVGPDGRVWVANGADNTVTVLNHNGAVLGSPIHVGQSPTGLAVGADGSVYVANTGDGTLSVINPATNTLDRTITVGGTPTGIALGPDGRIYVADFTGNAVKVIDPTHDDAVATVETTGANPYGIAVDAASTVYFTRPLDNTVSALTPTANGYTTRTVDAGTTPTAITLGANGILYVANTSSNTVTTLDPRSSTTTTIGTGTSPNALTTGPDGKLYITNGGSDTLSIINTQTGSTTTCAVGVNTNTVTIDSRGNITVTNKYDGSTSTIRHPITGTVTTTNTVTTGTVTTGTATNTGFTVTVQHPYGTVVSPDSRYAYVTNSGQGSVSIINPASGTVTTVTTGDSGVPVVSPDSRYAYVTNYGGSVSIINPATGTATTIPIGRGGAADPVVSPDSRYAYVSNYHDGTVSVINPATGTATTIHTGDGPMYTVVSPDSSYALVANYWDSTVSVIDPETGTATNIPTGGGWPSAVVVSPNSRYAFITHENGSVSIVNPLAGTATHIPASGDAWGPVVVSPDSRYAYAALYDSHTDSSGVLVINPVTGTATSIPTGDGQVSHTVSPDNRYAYAITFGGNVSIINPDTSTATTIPIGNTWHGWLGVSPDSRYAYAQNGANYTVLIIDPATETATTIPVSFNSLEPVVSPDSRYVVLPSDAGLWVINPDTGTATTVPTGSRARVVVVSPDSRYAYVTDEYQSLTVVNVESRIAATSVFARGTVVVSPDSRYAYVTDRNGTVTVIDSTKLTFPAGRIAPDYSTNTLVDTPVSFDPTANPFVPSTGAAVTGVSTPAHGTAVLTGSKITYTPNADYAGTDTFTYTASDGISTGTGTITIRVNAVEYTAPNQPGPTGTQDLYHRLRDAMDGVGGKSLQHGVYTEHVLVNGSEALIVYIAGTHTLTGDQSVLKNLPSAAGIVDTGQIDVIKAAMASSEEPILLVGYSQGGMDAQNIAAHAAEYGLQDQIKAVITYGSPLVQTDKYPTVHLEDAGDLIPKFNLLTPTNWIAGLVNSLANKNVYLTTTTNTFDSRARTNPFFVHGDPATYQAVGLQFDGDKSSHWSSLRTALTTFLSGRLVPEGYTVLNGQIVPASPPTEF